MSSNFIPNPVVVNAFTTAGAVLGFGIGMNESKGDPVGGFAGAVLGICFGHVLGGVAGIAANAFAATYRDCIRPFGAYGMELVKRYPYIAAAFATGMVAQAIFIAARK